MKNYDVIVVGSGITGLLAAYASAKTGLKTAVIERNPTLGGIMRGFTWENTHFDFGCHIVGNDQNATTAYIKEILDAEWDPMEVSVGSIYQGQLTRGFEIPDLTRLPQNVKESFLQEAEKDRRPLSTLEDWLIAHYGKTLTPYLAPCVQKMFLRPASELAAEAAPATPFRRLRLFEDDRAHQLKKDPKWDNLLAATPQHTTPRAYYPRQTGISYLIHKTEEKLKSLNVNIMTSCQINDVTRNDNTFTITTDNESLSAQQLIWTAGLVNLIQSTNTTLDSTIDIDSKIKRVPMVLFYYVFSKDNEGDIDYLHCFDKEENFFRMSVPGRYGHKNCQDGESYLCIEATTDMGSAIWNRPETVMTALWEKAGKYGLVRPGSTYLKATTKKTPVSYKVPLVGYNQAAEPFLDFAQENGIILGDEWAFTKAGLVTKILEDIGIKQAA